MIKTRATSNPFAVSGDRLDRDRFCDARQIDVERRALTGCAGDFDRAAVAGHDAVDDGKAEPGALADLLRRKKWLEDAADCRHIHAVAGIADGKLGIGACFQACKTTLQSAI